MGLAMWEHVSSTRNPSAACKKRSALVSPCAFPAPRRFFFPPLPRCSFHCPAARLARGTRLKRRPGTFFDFHSMRNVTLWFPVLTFKRQEARKRGVLIRAARWRSAREGGGTQREGWGGWMKEDGGRDGGEGEMKAGRGWREGVEWACELQESLRVCVCVFRQIPADWARASQCSVFIFQADGWIDIYYPAVYYVRMFVLYVCVCARARRCARAAQ